MMTRILGKNKAQWKEELFGTYPKLLRDVARGYPQAVVDPRITGTLSIFQANMLAALAQSKEQDFNQDVEIENRQTKWTKHYARKILRQAGGLCKETKDERILRIAVDQKRSDMRKGIIQFDPLEYEVIGLGMRPFEAYLKRANLRYTTFSTPHRCPLCQNGESWTLQHEELTRMKTKAGLEGEVFSAKRLKHLNDLETKVKNYKLHKAQLEVCRAEVKALEDGLVPGQAIVIRDYVNHHDHSGGHVKCLHWVVMWRTKPNGDLQHLKLRHYCSDKESCMTDAYYTADVMRFHFKPKGKHNPGLFDDFQTVYFVGDHGPHFSCSCTVYNESKYFHVYGKEVVLEFFASYHAFGRADGAGAEDSVSSRQDNKNGLQRNGAQAWTDMTNESNDKRSWAYHMAAVDRNTNIFPKAVQARNKHVRKCCEVIFDYVGRSEKTIGICLYRLVPGVGEWTWCDLLQGSRDAGEELCESCSTKEQSLQFHELKDCPDPRNVHALPEYTACEFNAERIDSSVQKRRPRYRGEKESTMVACALGCKSATGRPRRFRTKARANVHYKLEHKLSGAAYTKVAYPDDACDAGGSAPSESKEANCAGVNNDNDNVEIRDSDVRPLAGKRASQEKRKQPDSISDWDSDACSESDESHDDDAVDHVEDKFVVQAVFGHRKKAGTKGKDFEYLVKLVEYAEETWEPNESFVGDSVMLKEYTKKHFPRKKLQGQK